MNDLPDARILVDIRECHPIIEDQLHQQPLYDFIDSNKAYGCSKFLIRNVNVTEKNLVDLALLGHPDRASNYRIRQVHKSAKENNNIYVEAPVHDKSNKLPLQMLKECSHDIFLLFQQLENQCK